MQTLQSKTARRPGKSVAPRLLVVAGTALAVALAWLITSVGFGHDLTAPAMGGMDVGLGLVIVTATVAGLAALVSLAMLERWTRRPLLTWRWLATVAFFLSLGGPLGGTGVDTTDRVVLVVFHVIVALGLIIGLPAAGRWNSEAD